MRQSILIIMIASSLCAQTVKPDLTVKPVADTIDTVKVEQPKLKKVHDSRYQIAGGLGMMLFFGLAMGLSQSMNPR